MFSGKSKKNSRNKDNKSYKENSCSDERSVENAISFNIKN